MTDDANTRLESELKIQLVIVSSFITIDVFTAIQGHWNDLGVYVLWGSVPPCLKGVDLWDYVQGVVRSSLG